MYKRILVPLDGSNASEEVLPLVRMLAETSQAEIVLLRIAEYSPTIFPDCYQYPPADPALADRIQSKKKDVQREGQEYLEQLADSLGKAGVKVAVEICEGPVVAAILASAHRMRVDLIAMSTCGYGKCTQCALGAVADQVLRDAPVPVILFRAASHLYHMQPANNARASAAI